MIKELILLTAVARRVHSGSSRSSFWWVALVQQVRT
jgi:hypothetical protein